MRRGLLLFLKYPTPGRVKTRIAADLGPDEAAAVYRQLVARVIGNLSGLDADLRVVFDPPDSEAATTAWIAPQLGDAGLPPAAFVRQVEGDLGARLEAGFADAFAAGYGQIAAIGSDCVTLTPGILATAWTSLERDDVVLGPTDDGGYYLIGTRAFQPTLFRNIPWSTEATLRATRDAALEAGLTVAELPRLSDVDTLEDWRAVAR